MLNEQNGKKSVTIRMETDLIQKINELKQGTERNTTQQIKYMLRKYLEILDKIESKV